jgi:NADH-quinone oxidoreductase subunit F
MEHITKFIERKTFCVFGDAAVWGLQSNLAKFRNEFIELIEKTNPDNIGPEIPIRPIYRPDSGQASKMRDSKLTPTGESPLNRDTMVAAD